MAKTTIISLCMTLLFVQWHSIPVESADSSEAKFIDAKQHTENPYLALVEDVDAKSGWAVEAKQAFDGDRTESFYAYFLARNDTKAKFGTVFAGELCSLLLNKEETKNLLPKQIIDMIFPRQKGSCDFKVIDRAIRATATVNTNFKDNFGFFPETTPYELEVRIVDYLQSLDSKGDEYIFSVNFSIGGNIK